MKKIAIYTLLCLVTAGFLSCEDNTGFSNPHELTADEIAEMARQDSIEQAQLNKIDADLILEYTVNLDKDGAYEGVPLAIETDKIAELFGISEDELLAGINGDDGAPDVKGFGIDGTTHNDYSTASTTGGPWGHWWDANGDATTWASAEKQAAVYAEFWPEDNLFYVGQYPGILAGGSTVKVIEALKYNDLRAAVVITIAIGGDYVDPETAPTGTPENLSTDITLSKAYSDDYASVTADVKDIMRNAFKMTTYQIHQAIDNGDLKLYQGAVTETDPAYTADAPGYWLNADGTVGAWGVTAVAWCSIGHSKTELYLYGGNHPDNAVAGTTVTTTYIATCNGGSVTFNITFTIQ